MPIHTEAERRKNKKLRQKKSAIQNIVDIVKGFGSVLPGGSKKPLDITAGKLAAAAKEAKRREEERKRKQKGN